MMILGLIYLLFGMIAGMTAFLQAESGGWRLFLTTVGIFIVSYVLIMTFSDRISTIDQQLHPALNLASVLIGCSVQMFFGILVGQIFRRRVAPLTLGLRTTVIAAVLCAAILWSLA